MTYNLIHDPEQIKRFASIFIPYQEHLSLVFSLIARRKYAPKLPNDKYQLYQGFISGNGNRDIVPDIFYRSIMKLECKFGAYVDSQNNPIPDHAMALYCIIEPVNPLKAMSATLNELINDDVRNSNAYDLYRNRMIKFGAPNTKNYKQLDIDTKKKEQLELAKQIIKETKIEPLLTVETKNGFHVLYVHSNKIDGKKLHEFKLSTTFKKPNVNGELITDYWFSISSHPMTVIPGTYHGGFQASISDIFD